MIVYDDLENFMGPKPRGYETLVNVVEEGVNNISENYQLMPNQEIKKPYQPHAWTEEQISTYLPGV